MAEENSRKARLSSVTLAVILLAVAALLCAMGIYCLSVRDYEASSENITKCEAQIRDLKDHIA